MQPLPGNLSEVELVVALVRSGQDIVQSQPYSEFRRNPSGQLLIPLVGPELLDLLQKELNLLVPDPQGRGLRVSHISFGDPAKSLMRILGHVAEAVVVRRCRADRQANRRWAQVARRGRKTIATPDNYIAIGTGMAATKANPETAHKYNPGDTQRDIIWVNRSNPSRELQMVGSSSQGGTSAGLQVKCTRDGMGYVFPDILVRRYEVPVVYFDIADDFNAVATAVRRENPSELHNLIRGHDIDSDAHEQLVHYEAVLREWLSRGGIVGELYSRPEPELHAVAQLVSLTH